MAQTRCFFVAASVSFFMAVVQAAISFSPEVAARFQAPARLLNDPVKLLVFGCSAALIPALIGIYALSAAGRVRRLPLTRTVLVVSGTFFTLRGLFLVASVLTALGVLKGHLQYLAIASHLVFLVAGFGLLRGTWLNWHRLSFGRETAAAQHRGH